MTIASLLQKETLPTHEQEHILAHVLDTTREYLRAHQEAPVSFKQRWQYLLALRKRKNGYPLAYITGHKEFFGLNFLVNKHTLVPRPDTELLVELAMQQYKTKEATQTIFIDVGTGSGCIPISIAKNIKKQQDKPVAFFATDISMKALKIAQKNANTHGNKITFFHGSLLEPIMGRLLSLNNDTTLIITANLPYLTQEQFQREPSIQKEPITALVAQDNGLALYKELLDQITPLFEHMTPPISILMEIDPTQRDTLTTYIKKTLPQAITTVHADLAGHDRVVHVTVGQ